MELPKLGGEIPLPTPGRPDGPRYVKAGSSRKHALPQPPVSGGLPGAGLRAPLPHVLGDQFDHVGLSTPASGLRTIAQGLNLDAP
ncbi:hypothetical protein [Streptomyces sp. NPDC001260]|uniref:hypothetical protein n=1 Tax=Streptomyces sp. NPDC001260 TaxID=3364551 RepID=UPI0036B60D20